MRAVTISIKSSSYKKQRGVILLILLIILGTGAMYALLRTLNQNNLQTERDKKTTEALALAKQALIGYAVSMNLQPTAAARPGDLPCPDLNDDGNSDSSCGSAAGSSQSSRLGRLPWKTLDLPDLRDGYGERLWYAVSNNFKTNTRREPLNRNTYGTITVRDPAGNVIHNGTNTTGAIAVIIAPGAPITRLGVLQVRSGAGVNSPINYLDIAQNEDNADFSDGALNGFIQGVLSNADSLVINDKISVVTYQDLMPLINKRVVGELSKCPDPSTCNISPISTSGWWVRNSWSSIYAFP
ncbi:MAG: hypothetical protein WCD07_10040 [Burkholderiales bacterium]